MFHNLLAKSKYVSFNFNSVGCRDGKVQYTAGSSFCFLQLSQSWVFWSELGDLFISQNLTEFVRDILQDGSFFGCIVKFQFLAKFPVDQLSQPVVSNLILP